METPSFFIATVLVSLLLCHSLYARPLLANDLPQNLVLTGVAAGCPPEKTPSLPCEVAEVLQETKRSTGARYGPLFLSMLPKGRPVPPSGPSKRIHDVKS
ncbi:hypothetical protein NMG60_11018316 [Bertholletia excelsa]